VDNLNVSVMVSVGTDVNNIKSVYFVEPQSQGWIIEKLVDDIMEELKTRGIGSSRGVFSDYNGEDVVFNTRFLNSYSDARAKINSIFVTHIDDIIKEVQFRLISPKFSSIICLSPQDSRFVSQVLNRQEGVIGIDLPPRSISVRPIKLALFSERYADRRKNEEWLKEYFSEHNPDAKASFVVSFLGKHWESFCEELSKLEVSYEIIRYSAPVSTEYELYKEKLSQNDYLIYLGFDGGAMSVYDAIAAGLRVICPNGSYHQGLSDRVELFNEKTEFFVVMDRLYHQWCSAQSTMEERSIRNYVEALLSHWRSLLEPTDNTESPNEIEATRRDVTSTDSIERVRYHRMSFSRVRSALIRVLLDLPSRFWSRG